MMPPVTLYYSGLYNFFWNFTDARRRIEYGNSSLCPQIMVNSVFQTVPWFLSDPFKRLALTGHYSLNHKFHGIERRRLRNHLHLVILARRHQIFYFRLTVGEKRTVTQDGLSGWLHLISMVSVQYTAYWRYFENSENIISTCIIFLWKFQTKKFVIRTFPLYPSHYSFFIPWSHNRHMTYAPRPLFQTRPSVKARYFFPSIKVRKIPPSLR